MKVCDWLALLMSVLIFFCSPNFDCLKDLNVADYGFRAVSTCGVEERAGFCIEYETPGVSRHWLSGTTWALLENIQGALIIRVRGEVWGSAEILRFQVL